MRLVILEATFQPSQPLDLPEYSGAVLRGAFGDSLNRLCHSGGRSCRACRSGSCAYQYLFETPIRHPAPRDYSYAPHPYVISPPLVKVADNEDSNRFSFRIVLIGRGIEYFVFVANALFLLEEVGLGKGRIPCRLVRLQAVGQQETEILYDDSISSLSLDLPIWKISPPQEQESTFGHTKLTLELLTPLSLTESKPREGGKHWLMPTEIRFLNLLRSLRRRWWELSYYHERSCPSDDFASLSTKAQLVEIRKAQLEWYQWMRHSNRQHKDIQMGGIIGKMVLEGPLDDFIAWLKWGEIVHVGRDTAFGHGRYRIIEKE